MTGSVYFISGIDTGIGKTYTTGYLAKLWNEQGQKTITQKLIQTGNTDISEDIEQHREIMGMGWFPEDYVAQKKLPVILVSSGRLGSINHTILSLEALKSRGLELYALAYNLNDESQDELISKDTAEFLKHYLVKHFPNSAWIDIPVIC